jgi:hypothetical protein
MSSFCRCLAFGAIALTLPLVVVAVPSSSALASTESAGGWGPEETITRNGVTPAVSAHARVAVRSDGTAVAVWSPSGTGRLMVSRRDRHGRWTAPLALTPPPAPGGPLGGYDVAVGPPGLVSVVWSHQVGDTWRVQESHRASGTWTAPHELGTGSAFRTTLDGRGTTTVAWSDQDIRCARRGPTGSWQVEDVPGSVSTWNIALSSNADGDVVVAWVNPDGGEPKFPFIQSALRPHGADWTPPSSLTVEPLSFTGGLETALDHDGRALVVWSTTDIWDPATHDYANYVAWSRSTGAGAWSPAHLLTHVLGEAGGGLDLSMNSSGAAVATWLQVSRGTWGDPGSAWSARFRRDGTWGVPTRVTPTLIAAPPRAWLDAHGTAHAIVDRNVDHRVLDFQQPWGHRWSTGAPLVNGTLFDTAGRSLHLIAVYSPYDRNGLRARSWSPLRTAKGGGSTRP